MADGYISQIKTPDNKVYLLKDSEKGYRWNAITQGQKWSRICLITPTSTTEGSSGILSVSCTRGNVVCNATFLITASHSSKCFINALGTTNYNAVRIRGVVQSNGTAYIELYDTANSIASGTAQTWHCSYIPILSSTVTTYTAFTDGTTVPSGYTAVNDFTAPQGDNSAPVVSISRNGTTFTATRSNGTTFTFTQQDNNTTYSAGTGLALDGTKFNHSNSVTAKTAYVDTATTVSANGGKIKVTDIKYDAQGHVTGSQDRTITLSQITSYLPLAGGAMTGAIARYYSAASTDPMIQLISNNQDAFLWQIMHGTANTDRGRTNGYGLRYHGGGSAPNNTLQLYALDTVRAELNESGNLTLTTPNITLGTSSAGLTGTLYGTYDFKSANGFTYSGMATGTDDADRVVWFSYNGIIGRPVYDNDFKYNPSTNTLKIGTGTITATNYSGKAATAGTADKATADASGNTITSTYATKTEVNGLLAAANAMTFKGVINATNALPNSHNAGDTYRVGTAGTYPIVDSNGRYCEVGTLIICITGGTAANAAHWTAVETNEDGAVIGPASSTDNAIARFDGTTGRIIQNSGITINDNGNLIISHTASATMTAASTNPQVIFSENGSQPVHLIYTDWDSYRAPAGLKIIGGTSATPAWLEVEGDTWSSSFKITGKTTALTDNNLTFSQGGGWYMGDSTWIRTVGSKSVYMNAGTFRNDGTTQLRTLQHVNTNIAVDGSWTTGTTGTANSGDDNATQGALGTSILTIGNATARPAAGTAGGANNAQGLLRLYSSGTAYGELTGYTTSARTHIHASTGISLPENIIDIMFRPGSGSYYTHIAYETSGNEALVAATQNAVTSFIFVNGESYANVASDRWTKLTGASGAGNAPGLQIKQNCVSIGELIPSGTNATYKLNVNGTSNFKGNMTSTGNFYTSGRHISLISGGEVDQFIDFAYAADPTVSTAPGASWRIGALNSGSGDGNYFVIQTGGSATNATTWNNALRLGMNTYDAGFGGNVYPLTNNNKTLGTSSLKWNNIYATTFTGNLTGNATSADSAKWLMNRGGSTVTISDGLWAHGQAGHGGTNAATVWHQQWKQSGLTYTPSGGSATTLTDSGDMVLWLAQSATSNTLTVNMAIDGLIYAFGGFKANLNGQASTVARATFGDSGNGEHNANNIKSNGMWYYTSNGPATTLGATTADGALYSQAYSTNWTAQIAQDYRDGAIFVRGLNNGTWKNWYAIPKFTTTTGGLGSTTQPVYIDTNGELQACTAYGSASVASAGKWTTARTLTIGNTGKSVDGSGNVSWSLAEIGAAPAVTGGYLPLSGGTLTGALTTANNTWNTIGDDCRLGDINKAGHIGIQGVNGNTGIFFTTYNQTTKSTGGAITWDGTKFSITSTTAVDATVKVAKHASAAHWYTQDGSPSGVIKIKIKKKQGWMLAFTVRVYQAYTYDDYVISGYNYGSSKWDAAEATLIGSESTEKHTVTFGYDDDAENNYYTLWVSIPVKQYTGIDIFNVTNGYSQITDLSDAFEIVQETTSTGTVQTTIDCYRPWYRNETVTNATTATNLSNKPSLAASGNNITVTAGGKTSDAFTVPYATSAGSSTHANYLTGFSSRATTMTWGNQTGSVITCLATPKGGGWGFRDDNPAAGQVSMTIDGTVYIKEGGVNVSDAIKSISRSGTTFTYTTLWGNTGTFTQQDTNNAATHTVKTTTKYYVTGTETATTSTGGDTFDTGIYATTTAGQLNATSYKVNEKVTLQWNSTDSSLDFIFA